MRLNLAFTASIFNTCPGLDPLTEEEAMELAGMMDDDFGDSREERGLAALARLWNVLNDMWTQRTACGSTPSDCTKYMSTVSMRTARTVLSFSKVAA